MVEENAPDNEQDVALALAAGLAAALAKFPEDVLGAAADARVAVAAFVPPTEPTAEPWPPMRPKE